MLCKSGDDCHKPVVPGRLFCNFHAQQLDDIRADITGWKHGKPTVKTVKKPKQQEANR